MLYIRSQTFIVENGGKKSIRLQLSNHPKVEWSVVQQCLGLGARYPRPAPGGRMIGYGHGYAQGIWTGDGRVHFRSGTGTGTGENLADAGGLRPPLTFATSSLGHPLRSYVGGFGPLEQYSVVVVMAVLLGTVHRATIGGPRVRFWRGRAG